jgi:hypothetical protein
MGPPEGGLLRGAVRSSNPCLRRAGPPAPRRVRCFRSEWASRLPRGEGEARRSALRHPLGGCFRGLRRCCRPGGRPRCRCPSPLLGGLRRVPFAPGWRVRFRPGVASVFIAYGDRCPKAPVVIGQRRGAGTAGRSRRSLWRAGPGALVPLPMAALLEARRPFAARSPKALCRSRGPRPPCATEAAWGVRG